MQYIPLFDLCKHLQIELIWKDETTNVEDLIHAVNAKNSHYQGYNAQELVLFLQELNAKKILFHTWIEEIRPLKNILTHHKIEKKLVLPSTISQHLLFKDFVQFISPILKAPLFSCLQKNQAYDVGFTYLNLLNAVDRKDIETHLFDLTLHKNLKQIEGQSIKSEKELSIALQNLLSEQNVYILNHLSLPSNFLKIQFLESTIRLLKHAQCSKRLGNWLILELQKISWDESSQTTLKTIKGEIETGAITFKNNAGTKRRGTNSMVYSLLFIGVVSFFGYWLYQQNDEPSYLSEIDSSFEDFTPEERQKLDSLIKLIENKTPTPLEEQLDPNMPLYGLSETLIYKEKTGIADIDSLVTDLKKDLNLHLNDAYAPFKQQKTSQSFHYRTMKQLSTKKNGKSVLWKNESEYDILILVYANKKSFSAYLPAKTKATFFLAQNDHFVILPGQKLEEMPQMPSNSLDHPSKSLKQHFKTIDINYAQYFTEKYEITSQKKAKILLTGTLKNRLSIVDLMDISTLEQ